MNSNERAARLEILIEILGNQLSTMETKLSKLVDENSDTRLKLMHDELAILRDRIQRELTEIKELVRDNQDYNNSTQDVLNMRLQKLDVFRGKVVLLGGMAIAIISSVVGAFGGQLFQYLKSFS